MTDETDTLYVTDAELIRRMGVPEKIARAPNIYDPEHNFPFDELTETEQEIVRREEVTSRGYLQRARAAAHCGATIKEFCAFVQEGIFPACMSGTNRWQIKALDKAIQRASIGGGDRGYVYFMEMQGFEKFIKIGYSAWPETRLNDLQGGNPFELTLIAKLHAPAHHEGKAHVVFHHLRERREWFRRSKGLLAYIDWIKRRQP